jgi:predicted AlkP superfamily pyrophosphatase or phosphodiesterase
VAALLALVVHLAGGQTVPSAGQAQPILILISIDGWRWDYLDRVRAPNLQALAARGARADGLVPSFPTLTFPNHWTIVTGLLPDRHGIVSNTMVDRSIGPQRFTLSSETAKDPRWWGGEPIWTTAARHGLKSASMFWPGSEAIHPTHWKPYDSQVPDAERVRQVLAWLALPEADRPAFITLYFSVVDSAAHDAGPESAEAFEAAAHVDEVLGGLFRALAAARLEDRVTVVVVSDHGLAPTSPERLIALDDFVPRSAVESVDASALVGLNPGPGLTPEALVARLNGRHRALTVYRKQDLPAWLQYGTHPRVPAVVGLLEPGWLVGWRDASGRLRPESWMGGGAHGYSPRARDMHGLFVAAGPRLRRGVTVPPLPNIHLYAFMCELLGIRPAANDGDPAVTAALIVR